MKKLLNLKTVFIVMAVSLATFSGVKGYQYAADISNISAFLLENVEALARNEGAGTLELYCETTSSSTRCSYRCPSCNTLIESASNTGRRVAVVGVCRCGHAAN